mgnify:FL=1
MTSWTIKVDKGNCYITDGSISQSGNNTLITTTGNQIVVQINPSTKIDYMYDNNITNIAIPLSKGSRANTPLNRVIDLKRIKEIITVQGFLADEQIDTDNNGTRDTFISAERRQTDLLELAKHRGELTLVYGNKFSTENYQTLWEANSLERGCFIMKMQFTTTTGKIGLDIGATSGQFPPERNIGINITLIRGKDM